MENIIMALGGMMFFVLFMFLAFVFIIFVISKFKKDIEHEFEPKVTIVVPSYNEEKNIAVCIDSIINSSYPGEKMEIICVDDGSTDSTLRLLKDYEKKHANIRVLSQKHGGKVEALNLGVSKASNGYVLTIDADTGIERNCIREIVKPFADSNVGATSGSSIVRNKKSFVGVFQNIEYHYNNLIRKSFSSVFDNGIWFFGALACYRKDVLQKIGFFKKDTLTEDMDSVLEIRKAGYKIINVHNAMGHTIVPDSIKGLYRQRSRWWIGVLQSLFKNRKLFSFSSSPSILFLFVNQFWWSFYAFVSLPLIAYQVNYWFPYNTGILGMLSYLFRWFSASGPFYVLYKLPEWGFSYYSIFGVLSGIISIVMIIAAIRAFNDRIDIRNIFAIFFYFPYTIILNMIVLISLLRFNFWKNRHFIS
ncbi:glycosyltransferase family 2 protein [Candidatus Woesearchaeota archaeon]|nr:glycosyltransferase family 2 protein [Candidatus Woesearchaeota archaeon]MBI2130443.1 glycosyltransferase family 2 protein [Candidatus Woesearchaeota archaeon]MBI2660987.1 glycosyltransferase family 2 protein [Candidatus Woesearchaeota archaeon]